MKQPGLRVWFFVRHLRWYGGVQDPSPALGYLIDAMHTAGFW